MNNHRTSTTSPWKGRPTTDTRSPGSGGRNNSIGVAEGLPSSNQQHHHFTVHQAVACAMRAHLDLVSAPTLQLPITAAEESDTAALSGVEAVTTAIVTPSSITASETTTRIHQYGPFVLMCGKTFSAASGIAFHNTETLHRLEIQRDDGGDLNKNNNSDARPPSSSTQENGFLSIYKIGTHYNLYPALFCTCPSFQFQCINKPEALLCKHLLAVALRLGHDGSKATTTTGTNVGGSCGGSGAMTNPPTMTAIPTLTIPQDEFIDILGAFAVSERGGAFRGGAR